jgi:hypothetical protein
MVTVCKTPTGYTVNARPVTLIENQIVQLSELSMEELIALRAFLKALSDGIKIQQSCVTVK